jgi:rubredoxin
MPKITEAQECPSCKADLRTRELPEKTRLFFDGAEFLTRAIELYDKDSWECPDCGHVWNDKIEETEKTENNEVKNEEEVINEG